MPTIVVVSIFLVSLLHGSISLLPKGIDCYLHHKEIPGKYLMNISLACQFQPRQMNENSTISSRNQYYVNFTGQSLDAVDCNRSPQCSYLPEKDEIFISLRSNIGDIHFPLLITVANTTRKTQFEVYPCENEHITFQFNVSAKQRSLVFHWSHHRPSTHFKKDYSFRAVCYLPNSTSAPIFSQIFSNQPYGTLNGLQLFTDYNCTLQARYQHKTFQERYCNSRWRTGAFEIYRTLSDVPAAGPVFYPGMYQEEDTLCHVYFLAVPKESRRGVVTEYRCVSKYSYKTKTFNFVADCPHKDYKDVCKLEAKTDKGWSKNNTPIPLEKLDKPLPELELWETGENVYKTKVNLPDSNTNISKCILLICKCRNCASKHPDCTQMREQPCDSVTADLRTERVAVLIQPSNGSLLLMSSWVSCAYNISRNRTDKDLVGVKRFQDRLRRKEFCRGASCDVSIAMETLRCLYQPVNILTARLECENSVKDKLFQRPIGLREMRIAEMVPEGCKFSLSFDGRHFVEIYANPKDVSTAVVIAIVIIVGISAVAVILVSCFVYKKKLHRRCFDWYQRNLGPLQYYSDDYSHERRHQEATYEMYTSDYYERIEPSGNLLPDQANSSQDNLREGYIR